ncbi:MAG TPA: MXAN_2562 family outer membrane beta-barrel protein, partial [Anaeromyxobacter sp.]
MICVALAVAAAVATAAPAGSDESRRTGSLSFRGMTYRPNVDAEFGGTGPYETIFGTKRGWMFRGDYGFKIWEGIGALEAGIGVGFSTRTGKGIIDGTSPPQRSEDDTKFRILPVTASLGYRFDWLARRYRIPLELHAKASLERYHWWVSDAGGTGQKGATNGYSFTAGAGFLLDFLDPGLAREMDRDSGVNDTWLV